MEGIGSLTSKELNTAPALAPAAHLVAKWDTGDNAIAFKGRVVSVTAYIGDHYGPNWSGDYGRLVVNAVRTLGPPPPVLPALPVVKNPAVPFGFGKVRSRNLNKGRAQLQIKTGGPGRVFVFGQKIKRRGRSVQRAGSVTLPIIAKGKATTTLNKKGKVKVGVRLAFIPSGGVKSVLSRPLVLRKKLG